MPTALGDDGVAAKLVTLAPRRNAGVPFFDHSGQLFALYGEEEGAVYLVRPDGHVEGRWHAPAAATVLGAVERVLHPAYPLTRKEVIMTDSELDAVYTRLCKTMTEVGADRSPLFLARFAMLAIVELGDPALAMRLVDAAAAANTD